MSDIPEKIGDKELDHAVEELADYLRVNCSDDIYSAIVLFGRSRFLQGKMKATKDAMDLLGNKITSEDSKS